MKTNWRMNMENFNYNQFFSFEFPLDKMKHIYQLIKPSNYNRLYSQIKIIEERKAKEEKKMKDDKYNKNKLNDFISESEELKDALIKNQLALGLIYQHIRESIYDREGNVCIVTLNSLLTYEFWITVSHRMIRIKNNINNMESKLATAIEEEKRISIDKELTNLRFEYVDLKVIMDIIVEQLQVESIYALQLDYHKMSLISHMEKSLIKQE